jgi:hypothetical protein
MDEKLFGAHNGIRLPGPIITSPRPFNNAKFSTTLRGNPYYMAPGWNISRRKVDLKRFYYSGGSAPKMFSNPWDRRYGIIGEPPPNLEVIRANQMGKMSFI